MVLERPMGHSQSAERQLAPYPPEHRISHQNHQQGQQVEKFQELGVEHQKHGPRRNYLVEVLRMKEVGLGVRTELEMAQQGLNLLQKCHQNHRQLEVLEPVEKELEKSVADLWGEETRAL